MDDIYRHGAVGYRHEYGALLEVLDMDMTGLPCGKKAAFATKGYFAKQRNRRGAELGRVFATRYGEIVVERLFAWHHATGGRLSTADEAAERTLDLDVDNVPAPSCGWMPAAAAWRMSTGTATWLSVSRQRLLGNPCPSVGGKCDRVDQ